MTPSQCRAIEQQKRVFSKVYPDTEYFVYTPKNTRLLRLVAEYSFTNLLGTKTKTSKSWTIGKRGRIE